MSTAPLVLFIDLKPDTRINLRTAAKAAIAWADLVERTGEHFDPANPVSIELEASEPGSQIIKAIISSITEDPKDLIKIAVVTSLLFILKTSVAWTWEQVLEHLRGPEAPSAVQLLTQEDMTALAQEIASTLQNDFGEKQRNRIYDELSHDENVIGAGMSSSSEQRPEIVIPREDFPTEIFIIDEEGYEKRTRNEESELVLLKPVLTTETNKRWGFTWVYGRLGATITDSDFLERMASGRLNVPMAEGIVLHVDLEISEERRGGVWVVKSYNIANVIGVSPPEQQERFLLDKPE